MKQGGEAGGTKERHGRLKVTATKNNELKSKNAGIEPAHLKSDYSSSNCLVVNESSILLSSS